MQYQIFCLFHKLCLDLDTDINSAYFYRVEEMRMMVEEMRMRVEEMRDEGGGDEG